MYSKHPELGKFPMNTQSTTQLKQKDASTVQEAKRMPGPSKTLLRPRTGA